MGHEWVVGSMGHEWVVGSMGHGWVLGSMGHEWVVGSMGHECVLGSRGPGHIIYTHPRRTTVSHRTLILPRTLSPHVPFDRNVRPMLRRAPVPFIQLEGKQPQPMPAAQLQPMPATQPQPMPATQLQPMPAAQPQPMPATQLQPGLQQVSCSQGCSRLAAAGQSNDSFASSGRRQASTSRGCSEHTAGAEVTHSTRE